MQMNIHIFKQNSILGTFKIITGLRIIEHLLAAFSFNSINTLIDLIIILNDLLFLFLFFN